MVGAPDPDPHAQGVQGQSALVVGHVTDVRSHRPAPAFEFGQPLPRRATGLALGNHPRALGLKRLEPAARVGQLLAHFAGRVGVEEPEVAEEVLPQPLDLGNLPVDVCEVVGRRVVALEPLQLLGDHLGLEEQGLHPSPSRLVQRLDDDGRPWAVLEPLTTYAAVADPVAPSVDEHRVAAVPALGVAAPEQYPLGLAPGPLGALHVQSKAVLDEREAVGLHERGGRPVG
jgi:hypothetical protein